MADPIDALDRRRGSLQALLSRHAPWWALLALGVAGEPAPTASTAGARRRW